MESTTNLPLFQIDNIMFELVGDSELSSYSRRQVSFAELVKMYVNHRPCQDLTLMDLSQAFIDFYKGVYFSRTEDGEAKPIFTSNLFVEKLMMTGNQFMGLQSCGVEISV